jgi:hypothetical protein
MNKDKKSLTLLNPVLIGLILIFGCSNVDIGKITESDEPVLSLNNPTRVTILFVGNSLTYTNDMPSILAMIGKEYKADISTACLCIGNTALIDHWDNGSIEKLVREGGFDYIILQQGPSSQDYGRDLLIEYGEKIKLLADEFNATTAFYMVWPSVSYYTSFDRVIESYTMAAEQSNAVLLPVGSVWKNYIEFTSDQSIYGPDLFHPSTKGSFLAAWVIYATLFPESDMNYFSKYATYLSKREFEEIKEAFLRTKK